MAIGPDDDTLDLSEALAGLREAPGPPCDCPFHRRTEIAEQLGRGAGILARRAGQWMAADGAWPSLAFRSAAAAVGLGMAGSQLHVIPLAGPALALGWCAAAFRAGRPAPLISEELRGPVPSTVEELRRDFLAALLDIIGDQPAVFLRDLYHALQAAPAASHLSAPQIRAVLAFCEVPVHRSVRVGADTGKSGIKRTDVEALLSPYREEQPPSEGVDAGHDAEEEDVERGVEPRDDDCRAAKPTIPTTEETP
ncbi:hypothetical protein OG530_19220 [Streptomyces decoyicus]|uniref:hypothetical protein n=1 Tax=Streptomyces decoyicus TaxID=249567 RepID=UPI002E1709F4